MSKDLLIVFIKNIRIGNVKTRLAKSIGDEGALQVYSQLIEVTEKATQRTKAEKHIYFSDKIINENWKKTPKFIQKGENLGEKMQNSFKNGQKEGFDKIILIGSDLPDISPAIIQNGFDALKSNEVVFGPAEDGGYYLVGMNKAHFCVFKNKPWSTKTLLEETLSELQKKNIKYTLLKTLNDIDTIEDLRKSKINDRLKY